VRVRAVVAAAVAAAVVAAAGAGLRAWSPPGQGPSQGPSQGHAQGQPPAAPQQPVFRAGVKLVRVDVTVTGRNDQPMADLQPADFDVSEDGVPQKVEQLRFITLEGRRPAGDEESLAIRSQAQAEAEAAREDVRVFVIFLDDYHVDKGPQITIPIRKALRNFVDQLWPTDLVAVMDPLTPLDAIRFTRTKSDLVDAIQKFEGRQWEYFPVRSILEEAQLRSENPRRMRAQVTLSALEGLCIKLGGLREARKTVFFVSQGPPSTFGNFFQGSLQDEVQDVILAANRGNVTITPVDPQGLGLGYNDDQRQTLMQLAAGTGGRPVVNTNAVDIGMSQQLKESSAYYVLGYQPTRSADDGKYHKISVKVRRTGVHVAARQGYWAPDSQAMAKAAAAVKTLPPAVTAAQQTLSNTEPGRRPVELWIGLSRGADSRPLVTITWGVPDIPKPLPIVSVDVEVVNARTRQTVEGTRTLAPGKAGAAEWPMTSIALDPGEYELRFSARTADNSLADRWGQALIVPDFAHAPVALATPRLYRARSFTEFRALRAVRDPAPSVVRSFGRTDRILVDVECYSDAAAGVPALEAHVTTKDGRELTALPIPELVNGRARFELPVGSLGQGTYLLRVRAKAGAADAEALVAFRVVP